MVRESTFIIIMNKKSHFILLAKTTRNPLTTLTRSFYNLPFHVSYLPLTPDLKTESTFSG